MHRVSHRNRADLSLTVTKAKGALVEVTSPRGRSLSNTTEMESLQQRERRADKADRAIDRVAPAELR
jgi:hypothetical protein